MEPLKTYEFTRLERFREIIEIVMEVTTMANRRMNREQNKKPRQMLEVNDTDTIFRVYRLPSIVLYQFTPDDIGSKDYKQLSFLNRPAIYILIDGEPYFEDSTYRIYDTKNLKGTIETLDLNWDYLKAIVSPPELYLNDFFERRQLRNILRYLFSERGLNVAEADAIDEQFCDYTEDYPSLFPCLPHVRLRFCQIKSLSNPSFLRLKPRQITG